MIARIIAILEKEGGKGEEGNAEESCHTPTGQEESDGSTPTVVQHTPLRHQR